MHASPARLIPLRRIFAGILLLGATVRSATADIVIEWNAAMTHYNENQPPPGAPQFELRNYAMAHLAMFNAIDLAAKGPASGEAAAAQAAHDVLVKTLPGGAPDFDGLLAKQLAGITDEAKRAAGIKIGAEAAASLLVARAYDGAATAEGPYTPGTRPGDYQFTPPFDGPPFNGYTTTPKFGKVPPFVLKSSDQFRTPPPYTLRDPEYVFDFNEVKLLGARNSAVRSADQTEMAQFWYEMSAFSWNRIARQLAAEQPDSLLNHARLFAALNVAMADAFIAGFESKYTYNFWRPITAIRAAATDDNNSTTADPAWEPLMLTPPMPDYISTHASLGAAASVVLIWFFHGDEHTFTLTSTMAGSIPSLHPRTFHRISEAAQENAISRVFAGIHFRAACLGGLAQGRSVGAWVVQQAPFTASR